MVHAHLDKNSTSEVTAAAVIANNAVVRGDGGGRGIQGSGVIIDDSDDITGVNSITLATALAVTSGGTGAATLTGVLSGNGTSAVTANAVTQFGVLVGGASNAVASTAVGTATDVLTSNGAGLAPTFQSIPPGIGGSTGATDNALLKADGVGGSTLQSEPDMLLTDDGKLQGPNGAASAPTYAFSGSTFSGMYLAGGGVGIAYNNSLRMEIGASYIDGNTGASFSLRRLTGSASLPIYTFDTDTDTGMYRVAANHIGFSTGTTLALDIDASQVVTLANALAETSGGTGLAAYTAGDILYSDAANSLAVLAKGSDTEILTLASGLPSWAAPAGGALAWTSITSGSLSGTALTVTSGLGTAYDEYMFILKDMSPDGAGNLQLGISDDGGSTYAVGLAGYILKGGDGALYGTANPIVIGLAIDSPDSQNLILNITNGKLANYKTLSWNLTNATSNSENGWGNYNLLTNNDIDAVQISLSANNFDAGTYVVYGR